MLLPIAGMETNILYTTNNRQYIYKNTLSQPSTILVDLLHIYLIKLVSYAQPVSVHIAPGHRCTACTGARHAQSSNSRHESVLDGG